MAFIIADSEKERWESLSEEKRAKLTEDAQWMMDNYSDDATLTDVETALAFGF